GVYERDAGWFAGNPSTMYSTPPSAVYPELVRMAGGPAAVAARARALIEGGSILEGLPLADMGPPDGRRARPPPDRRRFDPRRSPARRHGAPGRCRRSRGARSSAAGARDAGSEVGQLQRARLAALRHQHYPEPSPGGGAVITTPDSRARTRRRTRRPAG